jgi:hypothetical protein
VKWYKYVIVWPKIKAVYAAALIAFCYSAPTEAQTLTITENQAMSFGTLAKPASGSQFMNLRLNNTLSGTGSRIAGTPATGIYILRRSGGPSTNIPISIDIMNATSSSPALTFSNITGRYASTAISAFPQGGLPMPRNVNRTLRIGMRATYTSAIVTGPISAGFDIVVLFE